MKRLLSATLAFTLAAAPMALAQPMGGPGSPPPPPPGGPGPGHDHGHGPGGPGYHHGHPPPPPPGGWHHWARGEHFNAPHGYWQPVPDWRGHPGLYPPPPGQQWVWYNNQYVLVAIASGIIGAVIGASMAPSP